MIDLTRHGAEGSLQHSFERERTDWRVTAWREDLHWFCVHTIDINVHRCCSVTDILQQNHTSFYVSFVFNGEQTSFKKVILRKRWDLRVSARWSDKDERGRDDSAHGLKEALSLISWPPSDPESRCVDPASRDPAEQSAGSQPSPPRLQPHWSPAL